MVNDYSDEGKLHIVPYDTRYRPIAPPETGIFDEPTAMVCVNVEWIGHIDGALERLLWRDAWDGDLTTQLRAVKEIRKLLSEIHRRLPCCDCEDDMNCEQMIECLQPLFDNLNTRLDTIEANIEALQEVVDTVQEQSDSLQEAVENNAAKPQSQVSDCDDAENVYSGCLNLVDKMHQDNEILYVDAESSLADDAEEWAAVIVLFFPEFGGLPFGALLALANSMYSNQASDYSDDFLLVREDMAFKLYCRVTNNNCTIDQNVIGIWLDALPGQFPTNKAAEVFGRYAPTRITFLNQIAALLNSEKSLQAYFAELITAYNFGAESTETLPGGMECPEFGEPIITLDWDDADLGGTDVIDLGFGRWEVLATVGDTLTDLNVSIQDVEGRVFEVTGFEYPDGQVAACTVKRTSGTTTSECGGPDVTGPCDRYGWTWQVEEAPQRVRFTLVLA